MSRSSRRSLLAVLALVLLASLLQGAAHAVEIPGLSDAMKAMTDAPRELEGGEKDPVWRMYSAWTGFTNGWLVLDMLQVLGLATALAAAIAYHPVVRKKAASLEQLDQPKTFIMYSMVGALATLLASVNAVFGAVIFGIGGLMRFRTEVGEAKDTGRVILVTAVGLCCGAHMFMEAILATAFAWVLVYFLESRPINSIMIQGLDREHLARSSEAYRQILAQYGCKVLGERKNAVKGWVTIIYRAPLFLDRDGLERYLEQSLPKELRGAVDWNVA
jgi:hypothetical protein